MSPQWVRIDSNFPGHRKVLELDPARMNGAVGLYMLALCYADDHRTDGVIPTRAMRLITATDAWAEDAAELVRVGLWHETPDGWQIHDYLGWQRSAAEIEARSAAARDKARKRWEPGRSDTDSDADSNADSNAIGIAVGNAEQSSIEQHREEQQQSEQIAAALSKWHGSNIASARIAALEESHGKELVSQAAHELMLREPGSIDKPLAILGRIIGDKAQAGKATPRGPRKQSCPKCSGLGRVYNPSSGTEDIMCPECLGERFIAHA